MRVDFLIHGSSFSTRVEISARGSAFCPRAWKFGPADLHFSTHADIFDPPMCIFPRAWKFPPMDLHFPRVLIWGPTDLHFYMRVEISAHGSACCHARVEMSARGSGFVHARGNFGPQICMFPRAFFHANLFFGLHICICQCAWMFFARRSAFFHARGNFSPPDLFATRVDIWTRGSAFLPRAWKF